MIIIVVERKGRVYAYDENKKCIISKDGLLYNYTEKYVAIKRINNDNQNLIIDVYNSDGKIVCSYPYDFDFDNINGIIG